MLAYTYVEHGKFELLEKLRPQIKDARDAIVRVTLGSICTSDLQNMAVSRVQFLVLQSATRWWALWRK